ncbi:hypothetical protein AAFF_G00330570 [Aldrovandia affinis]|uniref:Pyrin domain-containing protein n=1 Tax=Aldrovandia affinis TaxID=143900 RepID=A0AAD7R742_9TELE|nr:hypothetical protein AAFF_G00330570 [Aldrovandia affinis]
MEEPVYDLILAALDDLSADQINRFKHKLSSLHKIGYGLTERESNADITVRIIRKFTKTHAIARTAQVFRAIELHDQAGDLDTEANARQGASSAAGTGNTGGSAAGPSSTQTEEPRRLMAKPWRTVQWDPEKREELMDFIKNYKPAMDQVCQARVLLIGTVGSGKSSFFNSISSIFQGHVTHQATSGSDSYKLTTQFRTYQVKAGRDRGPLPFIMCDTMGLERVCGSGLHMEDITSILKGHVMDRYEFNSAVPLQPDSPGYRRSPALGHRVHCLVYVLDASRFSLMPNDIVMKLATIRHKANMMGVPQLVVMTKVDEACPDVAVELKYVYRSRYIKKTVEAVGEHLGVPLSCIVPVKCYTQELDLEHSTDILLLYALQQALRLADSYYDNLSQEGDEDRE